MADNRHSARQLPSIVTELLSPDFSRASIQPDKTGIHGVTAGRRKQDWWEQPVPSIFPQAYLDIAAARGANNAAIMVQAGLDASLFARRNNEISMLQMHRLIELVLAAVGDGGIGVDVGWRLPPTAFGNFGYALLCSETMADVMQLCQRFWHLVGRGVSLSVQEHGDLCVIDVVTVAALPEPFSHLIYEATLTSLCRGLQLLIATPVTDMEIWFEFPAPDYASDVTSRLGCVRYGMPSNQFRFPKKYLNTRLGMHNPTGLKFAIEQCEREEALLDVTQNKIRAKVQQEMSLGAAGYPSLEALSQCLNITARTLRRRLDQAGTSYKTLLEEAKRRDAIRLLDDRELDIQKVAGLLGYQDPANFTRAFRGWTGQTPSQYRLARVAD